MTLPALKSVDSAAIREVAAGLRKHGARAAIMLTGLALREKPMEMAE